MKSRVLGLALLLSVGACAEPQEGIVYARYYYPQTQWVQMTCMAYNKQGFCMSQIPVIQTEPEHWSLGLRNGDEEGTRSVTLNEYERCHNDDHYPECGRLK
jgi:hypothetical protein